MTEVMTTTQEDVAGAMGRLLCDLGATASTILARIGLRTGLWNALADGGLTRAEVASRAHVAPAYARDWLHAMTAAGYVDFDPAAETFRLAPGFEVVMTGAMRGLVEGTTAQLAVWWELEDRYVEVFGSGAGILWADLPVGHAEAMDRISRTVVVPELVGSWVPSVDGLAARLSAGGRIADVGCGYGAAAVALAASYDAAQCVGIDLDDASVSRARAAAIEAGVADRVTFEVASADQLSRGPYDLVLFSDSLHDLGRPELALARARDQLSEDGVVLVVEHAGSERLEDNLDPVGRFFYACSALVCTPNALADDPTAMPLGSVPGERPLRELAAASGFGRVERLEVTAPMNLVLVMRR